MTAAHVVYMGGARGFYVGTASQLIPMPTAVDNHRFATAAEAQKWADALNQRAAR